VVERARTQPEGGHVGARRARRAGCWAVLSTARRAASRAEEFAVVSKKPTDRNSAARAPAQHLHRQRRHRLHMRRRHLDDLVVAIACGSLEMCCSPISVDVYPNSRRVLDDVMAVIAQRPSTWARPACRCSGRTAVSRQARLAEQVGAAQKPGGTARPGRRAPATLGIGTGSP